MMGDMGSSDEEIESISMSENATKSTQPMSSERKGSHNEGSRPKKCKTNSNRPSTSTSSIHEVIMNRVTINEGQSFKKGMDQGMNGSLESTIQDNRGERTDKGRQPQV